MFKITSHFTALFMSVLVGICLVSAESAFAMVGINDDALTVFVHLSELGRRDISLVMQPRDGAYRAVQPLYQSMLKSAARSLTAIAVTACIMTTVQFMSGACADEDSARLSSYCSRLLTGSALAGAVGIAGLWWLCLVRERYR